MFGKELKIISVIDRLENIMGKGENAGNQHFLLFPQCFQVFFIRVLKSWDCVVKSLAFFKRGTMHQWQVTFKLFSLKVRVVECPYLLKVLFL